MLGAGVFGPLWGAAGHAPDGICRRMIRPWGGFVPRIPVETFVDPSAQIIGDVELGSEASVWPLTVLRGDQGSIFIGGETNLQDGTIAHATGGLSTVRVGARCTVGHRVLLHGCQVGDDCLIGMGSILLDNCDIGAGSIVAAGSLVPVGRRFPPGSMIMGSPARLVRTLNARDIEMISRGHLTYLELGRSWRRS